MPISTKTELTEPVVTIRDIMPKKTVVQALAAVAGRMPPVGKNSKSPEGYNYRGIEQILEVAGPLLAAEGVVIVPFVRITGVQPVVGMKDGWTETTVSVEWQIHGPDGSFLCAMTVGIARDKSDKGSNKAQTQAYKYLLMPVRLSGS